MKFVIATLALVCCAGSLFAQDGQMSEEEMMKRWMEVSSPKTEHEALAKMAGDWDFTMKYWMAPDAPPEVSNGTCANVMVNGGRVISQNANGMMMGMPFEGHGMTGYDNYNKVYWSTWTDNMATSMMYMEGSSSDGGKTVTFTTTMDEPVMDIKDMPVRMISKWISDDSHSFESWSEIGTPNEFKNMEITYTRKK